MVLLYSKLKDLTLVGTSLLYRPLWFSRIWFKQTSILTLEFYSERLQLVRTVPRPMCEYPVIKYWTQGNEAYLSNQRAPLSYRSSCTMFWGGSWRRKHWTAQRNDDKPPSSCRCCRRKAMRENKAMIFEETTSEGLLKQKLGYWLNLRVPSAKIAGHVTLSEHSCT